MVDSPGDRSDDGGDNVNEHTLARPPRGVRSMPRVASACIPQPLPLLLLLLLLLISSFRCAARADGVGSVTIVTVASDTRDASALLASAPLAGIDIVVLGEGVAMPWPTGLRTKIILVRDFVRTSQLADEDLIVFVDAWDTMVLADSAATLIQAFRQAEEQTGRPIIFAPEEFCWPQDEESKGTLCAFFDSVAPPQYKRRYLNSGLCVDSPPTHTHTTTTHPTPARPHVLDHFHS